MASRTASCTKGDRRRIALAALVIVFNGQFTALGRRLAGLQIALSRLRFGFADHRLAAQALERVEIRQVLSRLARLHGDPANGTMADAGTRACCQLPIRAKGTRCKRITEYNRAGIDPDPVSYTHLRAHETG